MTQRQLRARHVMGLVVEKITLKKAEEKMGMMVQLRKMR